MSTDPVLEFYFLNWEFHDKPSGSVWRNQEKLQRDHHSLVMDFITLFLIVSAFCTASAQQNVSRSSFLTPTTNSTWLSHSGLYAFGFYKQGNEYAVGIFIHGIPEKTVVWTANRDNPPVSSNATLLFASDGRLVLQMGQEQLAVVADSSGSASASMLDSGNFVIYNSDQAIIWQSFDQPTDSLLPSQRLLAGHELFSSISDTQHSTGIFRLKMQNDGNLVQYPVDTPDTAAYSYFATSAGGFGDNVTLNFDPDGRLYLLNATSFNIGNLTEGGYPTEDTIYLARIDADGIFRLYSHDLKQKGSWSILWPSSYDECNPKGLCGLNGFCVSNDQKADCVCLPGFEMVQQGNWTAGCERNFTAESCKSKNGDITHNMQEVANTVWEDVSYSVLTVPSKDSCKKACSDDCNCEAALFKDRTCKKQRLPLRFGRRQLGDSNIAFVKVSTSTPTAPTGNMKRENKKELRVDIIIIGASFVAFGCMMLVISGFVFYKNHFRYRKLSCVGNVEVSQEFAPRSFTYSELEQVTGGFKEEVGRGSFGAVFKGAMSNGEKVVAVKRLEKVLAEGDTEFQTEMKVIGRTHHRNLVRLLGYCHDGIHRLLVYEYMSNGSLADVLFTPEKQPCWDERMGIARNIARGILYLHEECDEQIIHCDIKPQNILMDEYGCAKISDFGLAKLLKQDQTKTFTGIRGTRGYVAPEWHRKLPITVKADVYSYGIVLLEIICCRKNVDCNLPEKEAILEEWAYYCFETGDITKLLGDEKVDNKQAERMVKLGIWCIQDEPSLRPSMKKVLLMLEGTVDIPIPPSPASFLSAI
ncbi:G-type lectin S-receptor-like serine/threonine-protein kinase LECRK3 [Corylus avellana]|uniref:G-type lectin S-receptor-like serine/threonine-protein kinase LECRK3 n=1 Tax=Corylus avellana TaxID=13451 RepID=UPI00286D308B|nr:G-type lectin S-receptor-like serine/threonine-protein kinase LECRK3 [Corylus avellana]